MASKSTSPTRVAAHALLLLLWLAAHAAGQQVLSLEEAGRRAPPDFTPLYDGQAVVVQGLTSLPAVQVMDYYHLPIQSPDGWGLVIEGPASLLGNFKAGQRIEARGRMGQRAGLPVLLASEIRPIGGGEAPDPVRVSVSDLHSFRHLGLLVDTQGLVIAVGENAGGEYLLIGDHDQPLKVFIGGDIRRSRNLGRFNPGDRVRVTGIASQYCPFPPFDRRFQLLVGDPENIVLVERGWLISPDYLLTIVLCLLSTGAVWWNRERRLAQQRRAMRVLNELSEAVIAAGSPAEILRKLHSTLSKVSKVTSVRLYLYNAGTRTLDRVAGPFDTGAASFSLDNPSDPVSSGAALCFRNRTLLAIPDTRRSPLIPAEKDSPAVPRSLIYVPMFAQRDLLGVLEMSHEDRPKTYSSDEQAAAQHLGNQVAIALKLQEQQSIREKLFHSEKLAATGQLISGVADDLRAPLETITRLADKLSISDENAERNACAIASEARRASEIVGRLISFARDEQAAAKPVDLNALIAGLIRFRTREWEARGFEIRTLLCREPVAVMGAQGQLEQAFLNLLVHCEQASVNSAEKVLTVGTSRLGKRALVEIGYTRGAGEPGDHENTGDAPAGDAATVGRGICRGIFRTHGGDLRLVRTPANACRFEIELPLASSQTADITGPPDGRRGRQQLTLLLIEPDPVYQRQLLRLLSERNHRVVPVTNGEDAADLAQRLKFEIALCSVRLPSSNWVELFDKIRHKVNTFVLMTEGVDSDLARAFAGGEGYILSKPLEEADLDRILAAVEARLEKSSAVRSGK